MTTTATTRKGGPGFVLALCFFAMLGDGFDLTIYGSTLPSLMHQFGTDKQTLANIHSATLAAMMVGFILAGPIADRIGRRLPIIVGTLLFSLFNGACLFADSLGTFGTFRILSGIFLGTVVPSVIALVAEFAPAGKRQVFNGIAMIGYPVGGILVTAISLTVLPTAAELTAAAEAGSPLENWRLVYGFAAIFLVLVPIMIWRLPESPGYLMATGREEESLVVIREWGVDPGVVYADKKAADDAGAGGYRLLLSNRYVVATIIFTLVVFCQQVLTYGPNTWLPAMTAAMGFAGMQGTWALLCMSFGSVVGTYIGARIADKGGATRTIIPYFVLCAISLTALAYGEAIGAVGIFVAAFLTGFSVTGSTALMYGIIAAYYPVSSRGSAVGFCVGIARCGGILGPQIGAVFVSPRAGLLAFMVLAILGAALVAVLRAYQSRRGSDGPQVDGIDPRAAKTESEVVAG
ncbi:MAG: MFS transporter [Gordonia sp. (in: high G+C Gram-positive bacteria)]|uniref:MFS transporter n=1 Tax=Gordonia sp. (in: high G+C Gram-positive bacteria) TaxID=84139 RepID=UPI0039E3F1F5